MCSFIHLLVHMFLQQRFMGFYIAPNGVQGWKVDGWARLGPCPWGSDGVDQRSCLPLSGYNLRVLDLLVEPDGWSHHTHKAGSFILAGVGEPVWDLPKCRDCHPTYTLTLDSLQHSPSVSSWWKVLWGIAKLATPSNSLSFSLVFSLSLLFSL